VTQAEHSPPKFVVITNAPDYVHFSYQRFVINQLRKRFGFDGVPVRVIYKAKRRTDRAERMIARTEATAEFKPRQKVNATTRARAKAKMRPADPAQRPKSAKGPKSTSASRIRRSPQVKPGAEGAERSHEKTGERAGRGPKRSASGDARDSKGASRTPRAPRAPRAPSKTASRAPSKGRPSRDREPSAGEAERAPKGRRGQRTTAPRKGRSGR